MLGKTDPRSTAAWKKLAGKAKQPISIPHLLKSDDERFNKYHVRASELVYDFSHALCDDETIELLLEWAEEMHLKEARESFFSGDPINETEKRAVLHTALRNFSGQPVLCEGEDVMPGVKASLQKIKKICRDVHKGDWKGYSGKKIRQVVNIGIGGSDLGPRMVCRALESYRVDNMETYFVSNVDGQDITETLAKLDPERTLFLIVSKTFTTQETMANAQTARKWFLQKAGNEKHIRKHFVAVSVNDEKAAAFGIDPENVFGFRDWVGGRFSLWSPVGLSIALTVGYANFESLLKGAFRADQHFREAPLEKNIPVLMGLLGAWYSSFLGAQSEAILPYDQRLEKLPAFLQQASMESNGKSMDRRGEAIDYPTAPVTWGEPGTNGQHAFFQLLHQGTQWVPCDFIACARPHHKLSSHHDLLLSNFFAQVRALAEGKSDQDVQASMEKEGMSNEEIATLLPFRVFSGNRPSQSFLLKDLSPENLGMLIAFYEHKIFVQGVLWNIYSFDQWGVELGKQVSNEILPLLTQPAARTGKDSLLGICLEWRL